MEKRGAYNVESKANAANDEHELGLLHDCDGINEMKS